MCKVSIMKSVRVALVQLNWPGDRQAMMETYRVLVGQAADDGAQLVCLPELSISTYFPSQVSRSGFDWAEQLMGGPSVTFFGELARDNSVTLVGSIFEKTGDGHFYDTATIHSPTGKLIHTTRKVHIPSGEGYHETTYFEGGVEYPVHDIDRVKIAVPTCYDQWFPEMARIYALNGAEFIFYPTAIGSEPTDPDFDSQEAWQAVMRGHAIANGVFIAAANRTGEENGICFYGSSFICDPTGQILAQAGRYATEVIAADLKPYTLEHWRELFPLLHQRKPHTYARITETFDGPPSDRWQGHKPFNDLGRIPRSEIASQDN